MTRQQISSRIYPSVVTFLGDWRQMLADVNRFKLQRISLFLTAVGPKERREIYQSLRSSSVRAIPHVHARNDMTETELDFLVKKYKTKVFSIHHRYLKFFKKSKHLKKIFIETNDGPDRILNLKDLKTVGGVCVDLSHLAEFKKFAPVHYKTAVDAVEKFKYKVGCNHVSAQLANGHTRHYAQRESQLRYIATIPQQFFSPYICIELANPIAKQLAFKKYMVNLLAKTWSKKS